MSVHQLKDGRWFVQYRDKTKKSGYSREYFGRGIEAERDARDRNDELGLNTYERRTPAEQVPRFVDMANGYLKAKIADNERNTLEILQYKLDANILPAIGALGANQITPGRMDNYVKKRINQKVKRSTINRELTDIISILNWAVERRHIKYNPLAKYRKPKIDDEIINPPTPEETKKIFKYAKPHLKRALLTSYYTGIRPGFELFRPTWQDVDWENKTIFIRSAKKNGLKFRYVPIHPKFEPYLIKWHKEDKKRPGWPIVNYRGKHIASIRKTFDTAKLAAGITRKLPPYAFRHAFATYMLQAGGDLKTTSEILGHANPGITMRIYQHVNQAMHKSNIEKLPEMILNEDKDE